MNDEQSTDTTTADSEPVTTVSSNNIENSDNLVDNSPQDGSDSTNMNDSDDYVTEVNEVEYSTLDSVTLCCGDYDDDISDNQTLIIDDSEGFIFNEQGFW